MFGPGSNNMCYSKGAFNMLGIQSEILETYKFFKKVHEINDSV